MVLPTTGTLSFSQINQAVRFTNGNVGINTTAPGYLLDINGTANATNIISTSTSTGSLNASDITTGNLNLTGALYQNGAAYVASQWTGSVGSTLSYTSGNVDASNASFTNATISNLRLINSNMNYTNVTMSNLIAENVNLGMSSLFSGSFVASNNVSSPTAVTSLIFPSDLIRSFKISVSVTILVSSGSNLYTLYNILGNQTDSGWTLFIDNLGDASDITFTINSSGQLFYTSTNVSNFTSSTFRYSAEQFTASGSYASLSSVTQGTYLLDTIQINNTTDTLSGVSNGGLYVLGGATITKGLRVSGDISTGALQAPNGITTGNINFTGTLYQNGVAYVGSQWSGSAGSAVTYTSGNVVVDNLQSTNSSLGTINSTGLTTGNINFTGTLYQNGVAYVGSQWTGAVGSAVTYTSGNVVVSNLQSTNSSLGSINSTGLTTGALLATTSISSASVDATNSTITNAVHTTLSTGSLNVTNVVSTNSTIGTINATGLTATNVVATSASSGSLNATTVVSSTVTTGSLLATTSVSSGSLSATNIIGSVISAGTLIGTTITGANLSLSGNLIIGGTLTSVNITTNNLTDTNISAGLLNASSITTGSLLATTSISSASVNATNSTITNAVHTALSSGSLNVSTIVASTFTSGSLLATTSISSASVNASNVTASNLVATTASAGSLNVTNVVSTNSSVGTINATGLTAGNINFTGSLFQNGVAYSANAAAVANIITRYQTSGVVVASSGNTIVTFDTANNTYSVGATGITYSAGTFTNSNSSTVTMKVIYTVVFPYNNTGTRAAWVQDNNGVVSGYTDMQSVTSNSGYTTLTATSIITLASNGTFVIYAQSPGTALTTITGLGGSSVQVQTLNGGYAATQTNVLSRYCANQQNLPSQETAVLFDAVDYNNSFGSLPISVTSFLGGSLFTNTGSSSLPITVSCTVVISSSSISSGFLSIAFVDNAGGVWGGQAVPLNANAFLPRNNISATFVLPVNGTFYVQLYQGSGSTITTQISNTKIQIVGTTAGASGGTINATTTSNTLGSLFTTTSGNIGIGTINPTSVLQVSNSSNSGTNGALLVTGTDGYGHSLCVGGGNASKRIIFNHNGSMGNIFCYDYTILAPQNLSLQAYGGNVGVGTTSPAYTLDVNGTLARSGVKLPRYDNGSFTATNGPYVPILFNDTQYNVVEIKVRFISSNTNNDVVLGPYSDGNSTFIKINEFQSTTKRYGNSDVVVTSNDSLNALLCGNTGDATDNLAVITICRASGVAGAGNRNKFFFDTSYTWGGIGEARSQGQGHIGLTSVGGPPLTRLYLFPVAGTLTGTYSTVHYY